MTGEEGFRLRVLLPTEVLVDRPVAKLVAEGVDGWFGVLPRHADIATALAPGLLAYVEAGEGGRERAVAIDAGVLVKLGRDVRFPSAARSRAATWRTFAGWWTNGSADWTRASAPPAVRWPGWRAASCAGSSTSKWAADDRRRDRRAARRRRPGHRVRGRDGSRPPRRSGHRFRSPARGRSPARARKRRRGSRAFGDTVRRKADRRARAQRERRHGVWFGLGMFGLVGWAVAVPTLIGIAAGAWLDARFPGGPSWTLTGLLAGVALGSLNAWLWVKRESRHD